MADSNTADTTFVDADGRRWAVVLGPDELAQIRDVIGLDLGAEVRADATALYTRLVDDQHRLSFVLLLACWRAAGWAEAEATGERGAAFLRGVRQDTETYLRAAVSLLCALGAADQMQKMNEFQKQIRDGEGKAPERFAAAVAGALAIT